MTTFYCPHGNTADHDWESSSSQVLVCVSYLKFDELDEEVQQLVRERNGRSLHCICCHRAFSSLVDAAWDFELEAGSNTGFGMCVTCNYEQCGVHGYMEQCTLQTQCVKRKQCKEVRL